MSSRGDREFLEDIQEAIRRARVYVAGMEYDAFLADLKTQDAVIRTIEIIGEATKRLSPEIRERNPSIPWKSMAGVRDKLIHDYTAAAQTLMLADRPQSLHPYAIPNSE